MNDETMEIGLKYSNSRKWQRSGETKEAVVKMMKGLAEAGSLPVWSPESESDPSPFCTKTLQEIRKNKCDAWVVSIPPLDNSTISAGPSFVNTIRDTPKENIPAMMNQSNNEPFRCKSFRSHRVPGPTALLEYSPINVSFPSLWESTPSQLATGILTSHSPASAKKNGSTLPSSQVIAQGLAALRTRVYTLPSNQQQTTLPNVESNANGQAAVVTSRKPSPTSTDTAKKVPSSASLAPGVAKERAIVIALSNLLSDCATTSFKSSGVERLLQSQKHLFLDLRVSSKPCRCKSSRCLKLYCFCFQSGSLCNAKICQCNRCANNAEENTSTGARAKAIALCLLRRADAFDVRRQSRAAVKRSKENAKNAATHPLQPK